MTKKSTDQASSSETSDHSEQHGDFDIFRTEGYFSRLPAQRFPESQVSKRSVSDHQLTNATLTSDDAAIDAHVANRPLSLKERIAKARLAQEEALKHTHAVQDAAGPVVERHLSDAQGPIQERQITDTYAFPPVQASETTTQQQAIIDPRNYASATGPILQAEPIPLLDLLERIDKVRTVQQEALEQFHAMQNIAGSIDQRSLQDAIGPVQARQLTDTHTSLVAPPKFIHEDQTEQQPLPNSLQGPIVSRNVLLDALNEKIEKARFAEQEALTQLQAMQDAQGPINQQALSDAQGLINPQPYSDAQGLINPQAYSDAQGPLISASASTPQGPVQNADYKPQQERISAMLMPPPGDGPLIITPSDHLAVQISNARDAQAQALGYLQAINDADSPVVTAMASQTAGSVDTHTMTDAQGGLKERAMTDDIGAINSRSMRDAVGPVIPRSLFGHILSSFSKTIFHKKEPPKEPPSAADQESAEQTTATKQAHSSRLGDHSLDLQNRKNNMAERMAKVRSDQLKTINDLDSLEKSTVEKIKRMEQEK